MSTPTPRVRKVTGYQTNDQRVFLEETAAQKHARYLWYAAWFEQAEDIRDVEDLIKVLRGLCDEGVITFAEGWEP